ncbi:structural maintenance of chromosomes flexible hinge domain-containing protein GMI1 isoform X2 [Andrographis paniculata]|uniref:structural maintenance of chromosomes flexible hinge domain-containing protein GMI1 isoform X2 n=1 Tax=Andrographis paniculata TaxID=175694 RepID=UPI0021E87AD5|nr:structural maintenance of chromosomes flexible hinge domain-containing protein GMI1 isoform X2 [Andrographis paniculata]
MYSKTSLNSMNKRPREESGSQSPRKSQHGALKVQDVARGELKHFMFRILMPNGSTLDLKIHDQRNEIPIEEFIGVTKKQYSVVKQGSLKPNRRINWEYPDLHFTDANKKKIQTKLNLLDYIRNYWHFLWLHDGSPEPDIYEGMWDLTPDTDLLKELPDGYTCETALADLIDNSLQALWSNNCKSDTRLISVELRWNKIIIFDSGPGMDGKDGNLVKWGKVGASLHRSARVKAIGGNPPYLVPFFGMFGYGGPFAAMCLGRRAVVSSKTKNCGKVYSLHLEREALIDSSSLENEWRAKGGRRDPSKDEMQKVPHGSFTKVEIFEPKMKIDNIKHFQCKLKDIYFPYIQCDEMSGKTSRPVKFQVNGKDLAGINGGEVAVTNLHSCNGPEFVIQLHFSTSEDTSSRPSQRETVFSEANARLKFVYFPIIEGEENIQRIINILDSEDYGIGESYEKFCRVSIRRLGRLLPDARWSPLPIMEPKTQKGERAKLVKRCCSRVKCFIDTDAGFNPTAQKTDLAQHHLYTKALKNFGNPAFEVGKEMQIKILKDGKQVTVPQLEKLYHDWIIKMHANYDEETDSGLDQPTIVNCSPDIKKYLVEDVPVLRVHKKIQRKGMCWAAGQRLKVLKGACSGFHRNNVYATLECIVLAGLAADACGEAVLICRPLGIPEGSGCKISFDSKNGIGTICINESKVLPIEVIDSNKCIAVDDTEWENKSQQHCQKLPSAIEILENIDCQDLGIEGGMPADVKAGDAPPENVVAVIRPKAFNFENSSERLDQKFVVKDNIRMTLNVQFNPEDKSEDMLIFSSVGTPSSHKGLQGLFIFPVKSKFPNLFQKAGSLTFLLTLTNFPDVRRKHVLQVRACADTGRWKVVRHDDDLYTIRVGSSSADCLHIACFDKYGNSVNFTSVPKLAISFCSTGNEDLNHSCSIKKNLSLRKSRIIFEVVGFKSSKLDIIRPTYKAIINIKTLDGSFSVVHPCCVLPGTPQRVTVHPPNLQKKLIPCQSIEELRFEIFDECGNHVKEGERILLSLDGFSYEAKRFLLEDGSIYLKVDCNGFINVSNALKVSKGYGKDGAQFRSLLLSFAYISLSFEDKVLFKRNFHIELRELRTVSKEFMNLDAGSQLENVVFEIVDSEGLVDERVHHDEKLGLYHTLKIKSDTLDIDDSLQYPFRHGRCTINSIPLPKKEGIFSFSAFHSCYPELMSDIQVHVKSARHEIQGPIGFHGDAIHPVSSPHGVCEELPAIPQKHSSVFGSACRKVHVKSEDQLSIRRCEDLTFLPQAHSAVHQSPSTSNFENTSKKDIEDELIESAMTMNKFQSKLKIIDEALQNASELQVYDCRIGSGLCGKEIVLETITSKCQSAAALSQKIPGQIPTGLSPHDILGIVGLLGNVGNIQLSRMLALYLGDHLMCAIVCKNYSTAETLEANQINHGKYLGGGLYTVSLDYFRPFNSAPKADPQEQLALRLPRMQNGATPPGFLGFAVNMINIDAAFSHWKTTSGHGLRETLFYGIFGELQVYSHKSLMMGARAFIKNGAVSLDGGIIKGNGLLGFGDWEPEVIFPVLKNTDITQHLEIAKLREERETIKGSLEMAATRFYQVREEYLKCRDQSLLSE